MSDQVIDEAADWADRLDSLSAEERRSLSEWLDQSPEHRAALARMVEALGDPALFAAAEEARATTVPPLPPATPSRGDPRGRPHGVRRPGRKLAIGLAAGLAGLVAAPVLWHRAVPDVVVTHEYASAVGQPRQVALPDGSTMALDAGSHVRIAFSNTGRSVDMRAGAARFDVRHDVDRPFAVATPEGRMTALGTNFIVDRGPGQSELRVFRGRVRLEVAGLPSTVVTAGQWAEASARRITVHRFDPDHYQGWQDRWLEGDSIRLGDAIARLNRYSDTPIRLADPALADERVNGRFRLDRPGESLSLIGELLDLSVQSEKDGARVIARSSGH
jgi:transmembrane sensor